MVSRRIHVVFVCVVLVLCGCRRKQPLAVQKETVVIPVSHPVERRVTDYIDFTGRTNAVEAVAIRPRVSGYLVKMPFREGAEVKKGDLLFEVDPRPYQAQYDQAVSQLALYKAQLEYATVTYNRDLNISKSKTPGAVSVQQLDQDKAAVDEAKAAVKAFQASLATYKLNLDFTQVTSPIDGQTSRYYLTLGNLAVQDQTLLTTVVSLDPMYAYFDVDEGTVIRVRQAVNEGKIKPYQQNGIPVFMALQGEDNFSHRGLVNFVNNQFNPGTGSIAVRGVFENPRPKNGRRLLSPGMFVRIRFPIGKPHPALLVIDRAIGSDQGLKYVYVVNANKEVHQRRVVTGPIQPDGVRVVTEGLKADDWVVVGALQQVRPREKVQTEEIAMPSFAQTAAEQQNAEPREKIFVNAAGTTPSPPSRLK